MELSMKNELDIGIPVDDPLNPASGGYLKAFMDRRDFIPDRYFFQFNQETGLPEKVFFDSGLKEYLPKLDLESGQHLSNNFGYHNPTKKMLVSHNKDIRVLSYQTAKNLGLEFKDDRRIDIVRRFGDTGDDFLVSLDEIKDNELIKNLDNVAKSRNPQLPQFADEKYYSAFKKLNTYLTIFEVRLSKRPDLLGRTLEANPDVLKRIAPELGNCKFNIRTKYDHNFGINEFKDRKKQILPASMPINTLFRDENAFLKAGAIILAKRLLVDNQDASPMFQVTKNEQNFIDESFYSLENRDCVILCFTGCMIAASLGAPNPVTQNDINWFNSIDINDRDIKKASNIANKATEFLNENYFKASLIEKDINKDLWQDWKKSHEKLAFQLVTPSFPEISRATNKELSRESIIEGVKQTINNKVSSITSRQELVKQHPPAEEEIPFDLKPIVLKDLEQSLSSKKTRGKVRH